MWVVSRDRLILGWVLGLRRGGSKSQLSMTVCPHRGKEPRRQVKVRLEAPGRA